jgi:hypothetical protein
MSGTYNFTIQQGATFNPKLKYSQPQFTVKTITDITQSGQAVVTATSHGLTLDWPVWIVGVQGMAQINHKPDELSVPDEAYQAYYVDANSLRLNLDTTRMAAYTSGGELLYHPPVDLTGYTARMQIRETVDDEDVVLELTTENGGITLGGTNGQITLLIDADDTAALTVDKAVYDLELIDGSGIVTRLVSGEITVTKEVTRADS